LRYGVAAGDVLLPRWVAVHRFVRIWSLFHTLRVAGDPPKEPGGVVAGSVVVEVVLLVAFLARVAVPFRGLEYVAYGLVGGSPIGEVLLVGDDVCAGIE